MTEINNKSSSDSPAEILVERKAADIARDLMGHECQTQPSGKQLLALEAGKMDTGCDLKDYDAGSGNLDILALYKEIRPSTVHFELNRGDTKIGGGSGIMVKKSGDTCQILTDNHVVSDDTKNKYHLTDIKVVTEDGTRYDTKVRKADPGKDLAVVDIVTGKDTDKICKPVTVQDEANPLKPGDKIVTIGQPYATGAMYTAEGTAAGQVSRLDATRKMRAAPLPPGDDPARMLDVLTIRATPGFSGAGLFNKPAGSRRYQAIGLIDMADERTRGLSTPITRAQVKALTD